MINSRRKGRAYQAALAKRWRDSGVFPDAHSTHGAQTRQIGHEPSDIGGVPYVLEAKDQIRPNVWKAIEQAEAHGANKVCVVVAHKKGDAQDDALVCMRLSDWEALVRDAQDRGNHE